MADDFDFPIETDPELLLNEWLAEVQSHFPNFDPSPTSLAWRAAAAMANMLSVGMDVAAVVPPAIFRTVGESLHGIGMADATPATATTTWTAVDDAGYDTIPAETLLTIDGVLFQTTEDVPFPSGTTVVTPIGVSALEEGTAGNDLGGVDEPVILEEAYDHVSTVVLLTPTGGGTDGETIEEYTTRLRRTMRVLYPHAVRGTDLEIIARTMPQIWRAVALDNFDYPTLTANVEGVATVLLQGPDGMPVPAAVKDLYESLVLPDNRRLVNHVLYVEDGSYNLVGVEFSFTTHTGYEPAQVKIEAEGAIADFFDPAKWGLPGSGEEPLWTNKTNVSVYDIAGVLDRVEGLDQVTDIKIGLAGVAPTAGDKVLVGVGPLTQPGVVVGTAV